MKAMTERLNVKVTKVAPDGSWIELGPYRGDRWDICIRNFHRVMYGPRKGYNARLIWAIGAYQGCERMRLELKET